MKRTPILILSIVVAIILVAIIYFSFLRTPKVISEALKAVPAKTAVLIEVKDYEKFSQQLKEDNDFWTSLIKEKAFASINNKLIDIDSTFIEIPGIQRLISKKPILLALGVIGKSSVEPVYIVVTDELTSESGIDDYILKHVERKAEISSKEYQNSSIKRIKFIKKGTADMYYAFHKGLLIASPSSLLLESAIRQTDNPESIISNHNFNKVYRTAGNNVGMNIYIQYKTFADFFSKYIHPDLKKSFKNIRYFANWSEFDVNIDKESIMLNGFTQSNDSSNNYLNIFKGQSPGKLKIAEVLPSNSSVLLSLNLSDIELFSEKQAEYIDRKGQREVYDKWFKQFEDKYDFNLQEALLNIVEEEIALVYTQVNTLNISQKTYFVVKTKGQSQSLEEFEPMIEKWAENLGKETSYLIHNYEVTANRSQLIYSFPSSDLASKWLGRLFVHAKSRYFTFADDYMVFGNSIKDLKQFIDQNERKAVLENDTYFSQLQSEISSESNLYFYANIANSKDLFSMCFHKDVDKLYSSSFSNLKKFQAIVLQVNNSEDMLYSNVLLKYNAVVKEKPRTVWESKLDTVLSIKPQIVLNHRNSKKEIFIQDANNSIYLINENGKTLWKQRVDGKIKSEVYQIDYYKNKKLQYLFSTQEKIYIIDRNGNSVEDFPITLRAPATAGVAVFDYDGSRDYRFFIPCKDKKVYAYDIQTNILPGWSFEESEATVKSEIQHFRIEETDYILFSDKNRIYILNRRGEEKLITKNIQKSINNPFFLVYKDDIPYFTSTNSNGNIFMVNLQGKVFEKEGINMGPNHFATILNINENPLFDVIYSDKGEMKILYDLKKKFNYDFDGKISKAIPFEFSKTIHKVGITSFETKELFLFNGNGTIYKDFPLEGSTEFSISLLNNGGQKFNLIVGSSDGFLYNYEVP